MDALGLGKTLFNSSACLLRRQGSRPEAELILTERLSRKKASGAWPELAVRNLISQHDISRARIAENRDVMTPRNFEDALDRGFPFYEHLRLNGFQAFSRRFNSEIEFLTHHLCHAYAAMFMSPFSKCVILVIDGAGSRAADFGSAYPEIPEEFCEESSVYLFDQDQNGLGKLTCVEKNWQRFVRGERNPTHHFSEGLGSLYEKSSEYIFNSKRSAGKVMGLAPFGTPQAITSRAKYLEGLDWSRAFRGKTKPDWESSDHRALYADVSATVQRHFEESLMEKVLGIRKAHPEYDKLILMGGCALNCTTNMKLLRSGAFSEIYVPPFPGDESIALGAASFLHYERERNAWSPLPHEEQQGFFGSKDSVPTEAEVARVFADFEIVRPESISRHGAGLLKDGHVIGWFQGRSECGPRALGNRSLLARADRPGTKDHLNGSIKFREAFRPYGCSCLHERAHEYFDVPRGFENPFMSFAPKIREAYAERLREVGHIDGSSRMQTVRSTQNPRFHDLIAHVGEVTGLACVLNTSLNVMGDPIAETLEDVRKLLLETPVHGAAVGDFYVRKK